MQQKGKAANKALHSGGNSAPLRSIAAGELGRYDTSTFIKELWNYEFQEN